MQKGEVVYKINHLKIIRALNMGAKTHNQIYQITGLTPRTISNHKKNIVQCPNCHNFTDKAVFCFYCGFRLVESYG